MASEIPGKPKMGEKCNGCGLCCVQEVCAIGVRAFDTKIAPCPGLVFDNGRSWCRLVLAEEALGAPPIIAKMLGINTDCDSWVEGIDT